MKQRLVFGTLLIALVIVGINFVEFKHHDETEIKESLLSGYVHGAFNELNPDAMAKTFHKDFAIFSENGDEISRYPIADWIASTRDKKKSPDFDPAKNKWEHKFITVDVSGKAAAVELELHHNGKHVYTDYLSLLKFKSGWKVVAKVYNENK